MIAAWPYWVRPGSRGHADDDTLGRIAQLRDEILRHQLSVARRSATFSKIVPAAEVIWLETSALPRRRGGLPLVIAVAPGQSGYAPKLIPLMEQLRVARPVGRPRTRPDAVCGDKPSSSRAIRQHLQGRGINAVIPQPSDQIAHRIRRGSRGE